ncbi:hypothetical protein EV426DRAFT_698861 [Tirmania nivea]|nr:hypothetical protein EV426DRAFT_698861 [Tirmania nivea]
MRARAREKARARAKAMIWIRRIQTLQERTTTEFEDAYKRMKIKKEIEEQRLQTEDWRFDRQIESNENIAQMQSDTTARVAQIQAEAQTKQLETLTNIIGLVAGKQVLKSSAQNDERFMRKRARKAFSGNLYIKFPKTSSPCRPALTLRESIYLGLKKMS